MECSLLQAHLNFEKNIKCNVNHKLNSEKRHDFNKTSTFSFLIDRFKYLNKCRVRHKPNSGSIIYNVFSCK